MQGVNGTLAWYPPDNCKLVQVPFIWSMTFVVGLFLNSTEMPLDFNYISPPLPYFVNGHKDPTSQRFLVEAILSSNSFDLMHRLGSMLRPKCDHACYSSYRS
jgi:hypothetical protein